MSGRTLPTVRPDRSPTPTYITFDDLVSGWFKSQAPPPSVVSYDDLGEPVRCSPDERGSLASSADEPPSLVSSAGSWELGHVTCDRGQPSGHVTSNLRQSYGHVTSDAQQSHHRTTQEASEEQSAPVRLRRYDRGRLSLPRRNQLVRDSVTSLVQREVMTSLGAMKSEVTIPCQLGLWACLGRSRPRPDSFWCEYRLFVFVV